MVTTVLASSHCNCTPNNRSGEPDGEKGTTVWFPKDIDLAPSASVTWSFTDTEPHCSFVEGQSMPRVSLCLLVYDIETTEHAPNNLVRISRNFNNQDIEPSVHSTVPSHNITEAFDFSPINKFLIGGPLYNSGGLNTLILTNVSPINVQIKNARIFRAYEMKSLSYDYFDYDPVCNSSDNGNSGNIDYTRQDYPCNYRNYGDRISYTHYGSNSEAGQIITPGNSKEWSFTHTVETDGHPNYVGPYACFFNFNGLELETDTTQADLHYSVKLNGYKIADYYHCRISNLSQYPTVDLAKSQYYNYTPGATNTVELHNDGNVNIKLVDGGVGAIDIYRFYKVASLCKDDFSDSTWSARLWDSFAISSPYATVSEINNHLQVSVSSGGTWYQTGYVSHNAYDTQQFYGYNQQGFEAVIDVASMGSLKQMVLLISSDTKTTTQDPASLSNWYRIVKNASDSTILIQNKLAGTVSTKLQTAWASSTGQLKIKVSTGSIALYENGILKYAEPYALPSSQVYLYIYASSNQSGTGTFDNYALYPANIFRTEFKNGDLSGWDVDGIGSVWNVQNGKLCSAAAGSHIHYIQEFAKNRHVRADIQSLSNGGDRNVAWLMAKEINGNNLVCGLIKTGYVELGIFYGGQQNWYQASSSLDPTQLHRMAISIIENNAKVWVDGTLYLDVTNDSLNASVFNEGYIGLYTPGCTGEFDYVAVLNAKGYYTINAKAGTGGSISPAGMVQVAENTNKSFTITPQTGYRAKVIIDGIDQGNLSSYTFNNITTNHVILASFVPIYTITASYGSGGNMGGTIDPVGTVIVDQGTDRSFTITTASECYTIGDVTVDGISIGPKSSPYTHTFQNVQFNRSIVATFSLSDATHRPVFLYSGIDNSITITVDGTTNYTATNGGNVMACLTSTEPHTFYAPPTAFSVTGQIDVSFHRWKIEPASRSQPSYQYSNPLALKPTEVTSLTAEYLNGGYSTYSISASATSYGTLIPNGNIAANSGGPITFYVIPNSGYFLVDLLVNGSSVKGSVSNNQYTISNMSGNLTVYADFSDHYTISASVGTGGSISPSGAVPVSPGGTPTFAIAPSTSYCIDTVFVNGTSQGAITSYTFPPVYANQTINATFARMWNLNVQSANTSQGTVSSSPANGSVRDATLVTIDATPAAGYHFNYWYFPGSGNDPNQHETFYMLKDWTITAYFTVNRFTLSTGVGGGSGSVSPQTQDYDYGTTVTLYATPSGGWHFDHWNIDGTNNYNANPQVSMTQAHTAVAYFALNTQNVYFSAFDCWTYSEINGVNFAIDGVWNYYTGNTYALSEGDHAITYPDSTGGIYLQSTTWYNDGGQQQFNTWINVHETNHNVVGWYM